MTHESPHDALDELLIRGVGELIDPEGTFRKKLTENPKEVVIKFGVDPTRPDIHLGHAVAFRALRRFQNLGCKVVFLIGDVTALIGDPTGKSKVRPVLHEEEVNRNKETFLNQVNKILLTDPSVFAWTQNSDWYVGINDVTTPAGTTAQFMVGDKKFTLENLPENNLLAKAYAWEQSRIQKGTFLNYTLLNILSVLRKVTHQRLISRDLFQKRIEQGEELYMHEMLYPVLQGIDSSVLSSIFGSCDLEVGGTDQTFNMLMGRDVMKAGNQTPQAVLSFELLEGLDGKEKMSKSLDNYIAITDEPNDMYGKIMSLPDSLIPKYFKLCTYTPLEAIEDIEKALEKGKENPRDIKMRLAREIVEMYHGRERAVGAEESFINTFSKGKVPEDVLTVEIKMGTTLLDVLKEQELVTSNTDFRRLVEAGAVSLVESGITVDAVDFVPSESGTFRVGKSRFIKVVIA